MANDGEESSLLLFRRGGHDFQRGEFMMVKGEGDDTYVAQIVDKRRKLLSVLNTVKVRWMYRVNEVEERVRRQVGSIELLGPEMELFFSWHEDSCPIRSVLRVARIYATTGVPLSPGSCLKEDEFITRFAYDASKKKLVHFGTAQENRSLTIGRALTIAELLSASPYPYDLMNDGAVAPPSPTSKPRVAQPVLFQTWREKKEKMGETGGEALRLDQMPLSNKQEIGGGEGCRSSRDLKECKDVVSGGEGGFQVTGGESSVSRKRGSGIKDGRNGLRGERKGDVAGGVGEAGDCTVALDGCGDAARAGDAHAHNSKQRKRRKGTSCGDDFEGRGGDQHAECGDKWCKVKGCKGKECEWLNAEGLRMVMCSVGEMMREHDVLIDVSCRENRLGRAMHNKYGLPWHAFGYEAPSKDLQNYARRDWITVEPSQLRGSLVIGSADVGQDEDKKRREMQHAEAFSPRLLFTITSSPSGSWRPDPAIYKCVHTHAASPSTRVKKGPGTGDGLSADACQSAVAQEPRMQGGIVDSSSDVQIDKDVGVDIGVGADGEGSMTLLVFERIDSIEGRAKSHP